MSYVARPQVPPRGRFPGVCQVRAMPDLVWAPKSSQCDPGDILNTQYGSERLEIG